MPHFNPMKHRVPFLKRWVPSLRKRLAKMTWTGDFRVVERYGALFLVNWRNFVDRQIAFYGDYEARQIDWLTAAMREHGIRTFIDVGANFGLYTAVLARSGVADRVVALEPDPRNLSQLHATVLLNRLHGTVEIHPVAASSAPGTLRFVAFAGTSTGQSRVALEGDDQVIEVAAAALDDLLPLTGQTLAFKVDVERHEMEALAGMGRLLAENRCLLQIEVDEETLSGVTSRLEVLGYSRIHRIDNDVYFSNFDV